MSLERVVTPVNDTESTAAAAAFEAEGREIVLPEGEDAVRWFNGRPIRPARPHRDGVVHQPAAERPGRQ